MAEQGKTQIGSTEIENKKIRFWLRVIAWVFLGFYTVYAMLMKVLTGSVGLDWVDGLIIFFAGSVLLTVESVRAYAKRKLEKLDK